MSGVARPVDPAGDPAPDGSVNAHDGANPLTMQRAPGLARRLAAFVYEGILLFGANGDGQGRYRERSKPLRHQARDARWRRSSVQPSLDRQALNFLHGRYRIRHTWAES